MWQGNHSTIIYFFVNNSSPTIISSNVAFSKTVSVESFSHCCLLWRCAIKSRGVVRIPSNIDFRHG